MYVLFEGIDTCGKSTQIELISQKHPEIIVTHEPGGTAFGKKAREILLSDSLASKRAELLLFLADRAEHYQEVISPNQHKVIISDRGFLSGIGYALANGDFDFDELVSLNRFALEGHFPDKVILFLTDMKTLEERTSAKSLDGIELRGLEYLLEVQEHMKQSILKLGIPHLFVDATEEIETIHTQITDYLRNTL
ncbi:dTMP kinase [Sulfurovum sp. XGS-02]|uniref:dTMP kinase n=1 Tax=Sulfurovum sp. XGS-02 TaxID=2925411 RepID=UPI0020670725|nr:dTMP kinase [Sulfurovum sp. XGS-02]UPT78221.1 dTMP kinase [Sulfurovum sp. XGS-02]